MNAQPVVLLLLISSRSTKDGSIWNRAVKNSLKHKKQYSVCEQIKVGCVEYRVESTRQRLIYDCSSVRFGLRLAADYVEHGLWLKKHFNDSQPGRPFIVF